MSLPGYWRNETGGALAPAIEAYLNQRPMCREDFQVIARYLTQWIDAPCWDNEPLLDEELKTELKLLRMRARLIRSRVEIDQWIEDAMGLGIDPL